jgi:acetyl esterase/lipase
LKANFPSELYIGEQADTSNCYISPLMANVTSQHAPTVVTVAACDDLRAQGQAYAEKLRQSGVQTTEDILPGLPHGLTFTLAAKATRSWIERQIDSFASAFDSQSK